MSASTIANETTYQVLPRQGSSRSELALVYTSIGNCLQLLCADGKKTEVLGRTVRFPASEHLYELRLHPALKGPLFPVPCILGGRIR